MVRGTRKILLASVRRDLVRLRSSDFNRRATPVRPICEALPRMKRSHYPRDGVQVLFWSGLRTPRMLSEPLSFQQMRNAAPNVAKRHATLPAQDAWLSQLLTDGL